MPRDCFRLCKPAPRGAFAPPQSDVKVTRTQEELLDAYFKTRLGSQEATVLLTQARFATRLTRGKFDVSEDDE
ncbi:MAG: hypothetical protein WCH39_14710 [Schlesneria sp.]